MRNTKYVIRNSIIFIILNFLFVVLSSIQWIPTLQFILQSARSVDVTNVLTREDWFIPLRHLVQLFIPDYFGNPAKGNYYGVWNYGEFLSYIGIIPIFLALFAIVKSINNKINKYWLAIIALILIFITKNPISQIPYSLAVPFFSTAQPSRLIFLLDFIMVIFFVKGIIYWFYDSNHKIRISSALIFFLFLTFLISLSLFDKYHFSIVIRNSIQPMVLFTLFLIINLLPLKAKRIKYFSIFIFILILFDLSRVFWRFNTFADQKYIFPETQITKYLENDLRNGFFRISSIDARIMPPNFSAYYKIPSIDGYDPLYYKNYANLISGSNGASFNRIIQLTGVNSKLYDALEVKYVLSFDDLPKSEFQLIMTEGKTKLYKYLNFRQTR